MDWVMVGAIANVVYTSFVLLALILAFIQTRGFEKNRKFQTTISIFKEFQVPELFNARRYIYENLPEGIEGMEDLQIVTHLRNIEPTIINFHHIG